MAIDRFGIPIVRRRTYVDDGPSVMSYQPFIDDPQHIKTLEGQRFVVVRPAPMVAEIHRQVQEVLRRRLSAFPVSYPASAHVTLTGFGAGTRLEAVQQLVGAWARGVPALRIEVERVDVFPTPFQIAIVRVRRTSELSRALVSLRERAEDQQLAISTSTPATDWIFHMSVAYCSALSVPIWNELTELIQGVEVASTSCVVAAAEVVAFDEGQEYSGGVYPLQGTEASDSVASDIAL
jgi:2'-5' RNA ligase